MSAWLCAVRCWLKGHQPMLERHPKAMRLRCACCGRVTEGWDLRGPVPQSRFAGDPDRHRLQRPRLLVMKKRA